MGEIFLFEDINILTGPDIEVTKHNLLIYDSLSNFHKKNKLIKGKVIHIELDF